MEHTGRVHVNIWKAEVFLGTYGHWDGARAHNGTERVPDTYGHRNESQSLMDTVMVSGHTSAPEGCPGTHGHQRGAQARIGTGYRNDARTNMDAGKSVKGSA